MGNIINIKNINVSYGKNHVLKNVNIDIKKKDFFTFLGPSGCGKTTLLRLIAGFEQSQSGELFIDGKEVSKLNPWDRDVGLVFQNYALWPHLSVAKNISFGLEEKKIPKNEINDRVDEVLELVGMQDLKQRYPYQLSGGQQQRVALARTIVVRPKVLLLDEPLSNLDAKLRNQMRIELLELHNKLQITTIFVTHDQEEANSISDNIAIFNEGIIQQVGAPIDLYNNPENLFVANFLGTINVLNGEIQNGSFKSAKNFELKNIKSENKMKCSLLIRPQNISFIRRSDSDQAFKGKIEGKEFLGNLIRYQVLLNDHLITIDNVHQGKEKIYSKNDNIEFFINSEISKII
ncbi:MAG: polyamine ABC transporter ATP-binding protein [Candidatus Pelagibacter sp.]|nr:polyamine ABC transporter ATP-binding protein [Candidatus Pelagibacter sp.]